MPSSGDVEFELKNGAARKAFTFSFGLFTIMESANWSSISLYVSVSRTQSVTPFGTSRFFINCS